MEVVDVPPKVQPFLESGEAVYYSATPIRRAGGIGVWLIFGLGLVFLPTAISIVHDIGLRLIESDTLVVLQIFVLLLAIIFLGFSLMLFCWPWLSSAAMRNTSVFVSDTRVVEIRFPIFRRSKAPRIRSFSMEEIDAPKVVRRRGDSATLVLSEGLRERKTDGQTVYHWKALHGLPRADDALRALDQLRA